MIGNTTATLREKERRQKTREAGSGLRVRPFDFNSDEDYAVVIAIENAIEPDRPQAVKEWKFWDSERLDKYLFRRFIGEERGEPVAYGSIGHVPWSHEPHKFFVDVNVFPEAQGRGLGTAFYQRLRAELAPHQPRKLIAFSRENRPGALHLLQKFGFEQVQRGPISRLDVASFDASRFRERVARTLASGIEVKTLRQLMAEDPDWQRKLYELEWQCMQDVPSPDPHTKRSFEEFVSRTLGSPNLLPDGCFVALDGEQYVGLSVLWKKQATDELLETGLTGVVRSHRRRGIATAMKVRALTFAQERGARYVYTDNEENNPMFQINLQLGFEPQPAFVQFMKRLE